MSKLIIREDDGSCSLGTLRPYPEVVAGSNVTVTPNTDGQGKVTYTVSATEDNECSEYAAGTELSNQDNPVLHGCGDDGKGSIPLDGINTNTTVSSDSDIIVITQSTNAQGAPHFTASINQEAFCQAVLSCLASQPDCA